MRIEQRNIDGKDVNICVLTGSDVPALNKYFATDIFKKNAKIAKSTLVDYFLSAFKGKIIDRLFELASESTFLPQNINNMRYLLSNLAYNNPSMQKKIPDEKKWNEIIETYIKTKNEITAGRVEIINFDKRINLSIKKVTNIYPSLFKKKSTLKNKIVSCDLNSVATNLRSYDFKNVRVYISYFNKACETLGINHLDNPINKLHLCAAYLSALERHETASDFSSWALPVLRNQEETKEVVINGFTRENFYNFLTTHDINITNFNAMFNSLAPTITQSNFIDKQLLNAIDLQSDEAKVDAIASYLTKNPEVLYAYLDPQAEIRDNHITAQIDFLINLPDHTQNAIYDTINYLIDMTHSPIAQSSNTIDGQLPVSTSVIIGGPSDNGVYSTGKSFAKVVTNSTEKNEQQRLRKKRANPSTNNDASTSSYVPTSNYGPTPKRQKM